jgi:4-amino-4-deoxy-L-arabinose transferase-like glycosyltransferase
MGLSFVKYINNLTAGKKLLLIMAIGFLLRAGLLFFFWNESPDIVDETHYNKIAMNLYYQNEFSLEQGKPTAMRPPLYPAFLRAVYFLSGGRHLNAVRIVQIFISLLIIYLVFALGRKLFDTQAGLLAALLFAVYPSFLFFTHFILTEVLFTLLLILFVYFYLELLGPNRQGFTDSAPVGWFQRYRYALYAGAFLGLSALTRSILYPFIVPASLFLLLFGKGNIRNKIGISFVFIIGYALVISPWAVRNTRLFGQFVAVGTMGGLNLYMGNYDHTPLHRAWVAVDLPYRKAWYRGHEKELAAMNEAQRQLWAVAKAKEFMKRHKWLTLKRCVIKAGNFWGLERSVVGGIFLGYWPRLNKSGYVFAMVLAVTGMCALVAIGSVYGAFMNFTLKNTGILFFALLVVYFTIMHALVFGHPRYHLPLVPLMAVCCSWALLNVSSLWEARHSGRFYAACLAVLLLVGMWLEEIFLADGARFLKQIGF